jgi:cell division protein FtsQ
VIEGTPQIIGIDCEQVVLYEKLPIDSSKLREILTLTKSLKRNSLIPDSITYGGENEPVLAYGKIKVEMGSLDLLTQKVERLAKIKPSLEGMKGTLHLENWTEETTNIVFDQKKS